MRVADETMIASLQRGEVSMFEPPQRVVQTVRQRAVLSATRTSI